MSKCCLCGAEFPANFKGASLSPDLKDARLCLKCANDVKLLTRFNAPNQDAYEDAFYHLHKKLIVNKYPREISSVLFHILEDITTYGAYLEQKEKRSVTK
ncbi:MAG: hypothetical protein IJF03_00545 [Lachnospiraceae bacterium]|nr:hypothetical protein [Lachnospiraceae bacterium]